MAVGQCNIAPPLKKNPGRGTLRPGALEPYLGDTLGVIGIKKSYRY